MVVSLLSALIVTVLSSVQPKKACEPIFVTVLGILRFLSFKQARKAPSFMFITPSGTAKNELPLPNAY